MALRLPAAGRGMGIRWVGARGSGKSTGLGRRLCLGDFDNGVPLIVLDPLGATIDNFLDALVRRPPAVQRELGRRLRYVDVGGATGFVTPLPVYHRKPTDTLFMAAERPVEVWRRADPALGLAPIMGLNAVLNTGRMVGMALAALGWRVTEAEALLTNPQRFAPRLLQAERVDPDVGRAVEWLLRDMPKPGSADWRTQTGSYLNKVRALTLDDATRAIYGATEPGIDWQEVVEERLTVLVDFRGVRSDDHRRFGLLWVFHDLLAFIRQRSTRTPPVGIVVDELSYFLSADPAQQNLLADDFEELVARLARNRGIWLTVSHQELNQLTRRMHHVLMSMGTQIFGSTSDLEGGAEVWAKRFERFDPEQPKLVRQRSGAIGRQTYTWEDPVYASVQEQVRLAAQDKYLDMPAFSFWGAVAPREGELGRRPERFSVRGERDEWVQPAKVAEARHKLAQRHGKRIEDILVEIDRRVDDGGAAGGDVSPLPPRPLPPSVVGRGGVERGGASRDGTVVPFPVGQEQPVPFPPRRSTSRRREPI